MNFIHLRSFDNYVNAHIQLGMLQEEGINCHLQDEYTITIDPLLNIAIGGMKLMVFASQASRALQLLEAADQREAGSGDAYYAAADGETGPIPSTGSSPGLLQKLNEVMARYFVQK
ncbi:MAG TPA: DUF2007 domain-containing protein [Puia sp.]|nr:DUF2007 domain-containing protein [Puia sp.]